MKYIYLFGIILFVGCSTKENLKSEPNYYKIEGISRGEEYWMDYNNGTIDSSTKELRMVTEYNSNGNPITDVEYYTYRNDNYEYVKDSNTLYYTYDKLDNLIEEKQILSNGEINSLVKYEYNDKNEQPKMLVFRENEITRKLDYSYKDGKKVKSIETNSKNEVISIIEYKYKNNIETEVLVYNKLNVLTSKKVLTKVENGIQYWDEFDEEGKLIRKNETKYENGFIVSDRIIDESPISGLQFESFYNEKNLIVKTINYMENEPKFVSQYIYIKK